MGKSSHAPAMIALYVLTILIYVAALIFSGLSARTENGGLFERTASNVSDIFILEITPAGWTFSIWGFIYAWQALWLVYGFTLICRRFGVGYLYTDPGVLPPGLLLSFCAASCFLITWLFLWDRLIIEASVAIIFLTAISLHIALAFGHDRLERISTILTQHGQAKEVWFVRILVLNGLAFFNTWVSTASCFNFAQVMVYAGSYPVPQKAASTAALVLLTVIVFLWFILKNFVFEKALRFTYSPFIVLPVALAGIITKNWNRDSGNSLFTAMLLVVVGGMFVISVIHTVVKLTREIKRSVSYNEEMKL
ncbi:uncharacterized protein LOC135461364 isoform X2 [Liolophura sinensis]